MKTLLALSALLLQEGPTIEARYGLRGLPGDVQLVVSGTEASVSVLDGNQAVHTWRAKIAKEDLDRLFEALKKHKVFDHRTAVCHGECTDEDLSISVRGEGRRNEFRRCFCGKKSEDVRPIYDAVRDFVRARVPSK